MYNYLFEYNFILTSADLPRFYFNRLSKHQNAFSINEETVLYNRTKLNQSILVRVYFSEPE